MDSTEEPINSGRRSTRIRAQIPLRVTAFDATAPFSESGHTLVINSQGCGVRLSRPLKPGAEVFLDELPTGKRVTARVANCVPLGAGSNYWLVGIALDQPGNIWGIHPAPEDWGFREHRRRAAHGSRLLPPKLGNGPIDNSPIAESSTPAEGKDRVGRTLLSVAFEVAFGFVDLLPLDV